MKLCKNCKHNANWWIGVNSCYICDGDDTTKIDQTLDCDYYEKLWFKFWVK